MIATSVIFAPVLLAFGVYLALKSQHEKEMEQHPDILRLKHRLNQIFPEMRDVKVMKAGSSYTLGKRKIYLCTRDPKDSKRIYDDNTLTYVFLHELAHVKTTQIGHGDEFKETFKNLLKRAANYGLYNFNLPHVENYCGY